MAPSSRWYEAREWEMRLEWRLVGHGDGDDGGVDVGDDGGPQRGLLGMFDGRNL